MGGIGGLHAESVTRETAGMPEDGMPEDALRERQGATRTSEPAQTECFPARISCVTVPLPEDRKAHTHTLSFDSKLSPSPITSSWRPLGPHSSVPSWPWTRRCWPASCGSSCSRARWARASSPATSTPPSWTRRSSTFAAARRLWTSPREPTRQASSDHGASDTVDVNNGVHRVRVEPTAAGCCGVTASIYPVGLPEASA